MRTRVHFLLLVTCQTLSAAADDSLRESHPSAGLLEQLGRLIEKSVHMTNHDSTHDSEVNLLALPDFKKPIKLWTRLIPEALTMLLNDVGLSKKQRTQVAMQLMDRSAGLNSKLYHQIESSGMSLVPFARAQNYITGILIQQAEKEIGDNFDALENCEALLGTEAPPTFHDPFMSAESTCMCAAHNICKHHVSSVMDSSPDMSDVSSNVWCKVAQNAWCMPPQHEEEKNNLRALLAA